MNGRLRKWLVGGFLLGAMALVGAPNAQAQYPQNNRNPRDTYDNRSGQRGNFRDFERDIRFLEDRIRREKDDLRRMSRRYRGNDYQVRSLRDQIKRDERELKELKKEWKRAQKNRRYYR